MAADQNPADQRPHRQESHAKRRLQHFERHGQLSGVEGARHKLRSFDLRSRRQGGCRPISCAPSHGKLTAAGKVCPRGKGGILVGVAALTCCCSL